MHNRVLTAAADSGVHPYACCQAVPGLITMLLPMSMFSSCFPPSKQLAPQAGNLSQTATPTPYTVAHAPSPPCTPPPTTCRPPLAAQSPCPSLLGVCSCHLPHRTLPAHAVCCTNYKAISASAPAVVPGSSPACQLPAAAAVRAARPHWEVPPSPGGAAPSPFPWQASAGQSRWQLLLAGPCAAAAAAAAFLAAAVPGACRLERLPAAVRHMGPSLLVAPLVAAALQRVACTRSRVCIGIADISNAWQRGSKTESKLTPQMMCNWSDGLVCLTKPTTIWIHRADHAVSLLTRSEWPRLLHGRTAELAIRQACLE